MTLPQRCIKAEVFLGIFSCCLSNNVEEMQRVIADGLISTHSESEFPFRPGKATGSLNNAMAHRVESFKGPSCGSFGQRAVEEAKPAFGFHGTDCGPS
jgi:hypothetical protein